MGTMGTLAIYDVLGIQDFIFASPKVKENLGASIIVEKIFKKYLIESIQDVCNGDCRVEWEEYSDFHMTSNPAIEAEVIYIGGGNVMVAYQNKDVAKQVTRKLSYKMMTQTGDALKFAVAYQPTDFKNQNFSADRDTLFQKLKKNKYETLQTKPLSGIGITRQGKTDGLPAMYPGEEGEFLSKSATFKRTMSEKHNDFFDELLPDKRRYAFPLEFDNLGQKEGENYIAVVHIDGNNLGKLLDGALNNISDYQQAVTTLRQFSKTVDKTYKDIMQDVIQQLAAWKASDTSLKKIDIGGKDGLPIRPIIVSGDDITFVCNAKIAISLTELFLTALHKTAPIPLATSDIKLSACAGVAIVKSHFPFFRAYQLAEELCKSAKMKGKTRARLYNREEKIGNWLDFHIVQSGVTTNLREIRQKFYQVPGKKEPNDITYPSNSDKPQMRYPQYNLLWRPWCVAGDCGALYEWDTLKKIHRMFTKTTKDNDDDVLWKQSRLKKMRNVMIQSENDIENLIREYRSRGFILPECFDDSEPFKKNPEDDSDLQQTPYFDALELLDFYLQIS